MSQYQCGVCGDAYDGIHECWLVTRKQESLYPLPVENEFLPIGEAPEDSRIPERIRRVDISNL